MWFVTRRDDIMAVLKDAKRYTTEAERSTIRDIFGAHMSIASGDRTSNALHAPGNEVGVVPGPV